MASPGEGRVISDFASIGNTNCRALPSRPRTVYFEVSSLVMKGEEPFDLAKAKAIFATYQKASHDAAPLFPDNSKTGHDTAALPAVWEKKADFDAKLKKLGEDAKEAEAKVTDEATFKATFPNVQKNCGGCHETYRLKKS